MDIRKIKKQTIEATWEKRCFSGNPMTWRLGVDDLANDIASRPSRSIPEPTKSTLKKHQKQSSKMESMTKGGARNTILTTVTQNAAQTVIVEYLQVTLTLYAQWRPTQNVDDHANGASRPLRRTGRLRSPHWNRDWTMIGIAWAQDRGAWASEVRDEVGVMDAGATAPR